MLSNSEKTKILESQKWMFDKAAILEDVAKSDLEDRFKKVAEGAMNRLAFATYKFSNGNTFELDLNNGTNPYQGSYKFAPNGEFLEMGLEGRPMKSQKILSFSKDRIVLDSDKDNGIIFKKILIPFDESKFKGNDKKMVIPKDAPRMKIETKEQK